MLWYDATLDYAIHLLKHIKELGYRLVYSIHYHHMWCPEEDSSVPMIKRLRSPKSYRAMIH